MEGVTLILEISLCLCIVLSIVSVIFVQFKNSASLLQGATEDVLKTTSKFDMAILQQYDNQEWNGNDVRYAVKSYGTTAKSSLYTAQFQMTPPEDFYVVVKFSGNSHRKAGAFGMAIQYIIPNRYESLSDGFSYRYDGTLLIDEYYIASEAKYKSNLLVKSTASNVVTDKQPLKNLPVAITESYNADYDEIVGILFTEITN